MDITVLISVWLCAMLLHALYGHSNDNVSMSVLCYGISHTDLTVLISVWLCVILLHTPYGHSNDNVSMSVCCVMVYPIQT